MCLTVQAFVCDVPPVPRLFRRGGECSGSNVTCHLFPAFSLSWGECSRSNDHIWLLAIMCFSQRRRHRMWYARLIQCLLASCSSAVYCEMEQPKVWCLVMVVFVRVYFLHLFSDHAAVFSKIKLINRKLCTSWFVTESIRLMVQIHLLWLNTSFWDMRMNDVIMLIIM